MRLPSYRYITLKEDSFVQQLSAITRYEFFENSIVFDLMTMRESSQDTVLTGLVSELRKLNISQIPYRVSIITCSLLRFDDYNIFLDSASLPSFHKRKEKSLNVREASLLNKIKLKQKKISQIDIGYYKEAVDNYSRFQKKINEKQDFLNFLDYIERLK